MGPSANGTLAQWMGTPPSGLRKASLLDVLAVPDEPGQVGFGPIMDTGAPLGYSVMRFQSAIVVFSQCEGAKSILARFGWPGL